MSALAAITLAEPIIPVVSLLDYDSLPTVKVEHKWQENGTDRYYKMYLPTCSDATNKELLLYMAYQFIDAAHDDRLHLTDGTQRYNKFRILLGGDLRVAWQAISDGRANKTVDTFTTDMHGLIATYLGPTSFADQKEYMTKVTKPYSMSCESLGSRLRIINVLSQYLPGAANTVLYPSNDELKRAYFRMMPSAWKIKFAENGTVLDGAYPYVSLIRFMGVQEALSKHASGKRKASSGPSGQRGGRGGRGSGSYGGRGRGRGRYGSFNYSFGRGYGNGGATASYPGQAGAGAAYSPNVYQGGRAYTNVPYATPRTPMPARGGARSTYSAGRGRGGRTPFVTNTPGRGPFRPTYGRTPPRGPTPYVPTFYTDDQFYGEEYYEKNQDQFYSGEAEHPSEDMYYGDHTQEYQGHEEMYHVEEGGQEPQEEAEDVEAHWLDEFGL
jgi:hypothetical protein